MTELLHHRLTGGPAGTRPTLLLIHPLGAVLDFWDACRPAGLAAAPDLPRGGSPLRGRIPARRDSAWPRPACGRPGGTAQRAEAGFGHPRGLRRRHLGRRSLCGAPPRTRAGPGAVESDAAYRRGRGGDALGEGRGGAGRRHGGDPARRRRARLEAQPRDDSYARYLAAFAAQDTAAYADAVLRFAKPDAAADLPRIRCPTLLAAGRHDLLLPQAQAEEVRRLLPEGTARLEIDEEGARFLPYQ